MTPGRQLALLAVESEEDQDAGDELIALARAVVENVGAKEIAARCGVTVSALSHGLSEREHRNVSARWLAVIDRADPARRISRWFAVRAGFAVVEIDRRTDAEKLAAAVGGLEAFGEAGLAALRKAGLR